MALESPEATAEKPRLAVVPKTGPGPVTAPFLLTMPEYNGTLAAARCLGRHGVSVTMAETALSAPARWSRHVTRRVAAPPIMDAERFLDWLLEFGVRNSGHVLYATCDELAWLMASRVAELRRHFELYQPPERTILDLLDKKALHDLCGELGIPTLTSVFPETADAALRAGKELGVPLLLKPRTQILLTSRNKGQLVTEARALPRAYAEFVTANRYHPLFARAVPGVERPMLQAYCAAAADGIYSLAGFIGEKEHQVVARGAMKVLQRPRRLGVGMCFEEAPVDAAVLASLVRLCRRVGYYGVFEAEFVPHDGALRLLDFNPRFYGQMGFEIARALPLGHMAWLAARGDTSGLDEAIARARRWQEGRGYIYCHRSYLKLVINLRRLAGRMRPEEAARWLGWLESRRAQGLAVDATHAEDDRWPGWASRGHEVYRALRHPRSFLLTMVLDP